MAANWNNPALTSLYVDFLAELKARDVDVLTMNPGTNIPVDSKRWNPATNTFQVWDGAAWINLVLAGAGGGTGSGSFPALGTMAAQNANAVAITGGNISGVNLNGSDITSGIVALNRGGTGASLALGAAGSFLQVVGAAVAFGVNGAALTGLNAANISAGNLAMARMPIGGVWNISGASPFVQILGGGLVMGSIANMGAGTINAQNIFINGVALATGAGIPTGMMAYFSGACPVGWTFVAGSQGRVVRSINGATGAQAGADDHQHGFSVPAGGGGPVDSGLPSNDQTDDRQINGSNKSFDAGSSFGGFLPADSFLHRHFMPHTHNVNVPGFPGHNGDTNMSSSWPPFLEYSLCRKD